MQNTSVSAATYNGVIGRKPCAMAHKLMQVLCFELILPHARCNSLQTTHMGLGSNTGRFTHGGYFSITFNQTHLIEQTCQLSKRRWCIDTLSHFSAHFIYPPHHLLIKHSACA